MAVTIRDVARAASVSVATVSRVLNGKEPVREETRSRIRAVVEKLAGKYEAPLVRFQKLFDEATKRAPADYWIWDGVHPTFAGHQLMADEWTRTVEAAWRAGGPGWSPLVSRCCSPDSRRRTGPVCRVESYVDSSTRSAEPASG